MLKKIRPGALDENDQELADFLGVTATELEGIRYRGVNVIQAADILRRREAYLRAVELLDVAAS